MTRGLPWTFHLNGISSLLDNKSAIHTSDGTVKDYVFYLGILDLPTHTLGRRTNNLHIWSRFCRSQTGIEDSLGLPYSLIDLLCSITDSDIEARLQSWPGEPGTPEQVQVWDLNRHAGRIAACQHRPTGSNNDSIALAVRHIMTTIIAIKTKVGRLAYETWSGLLFPLVTAGSQAHYLGASDKSLIVECMKDLPYGSLEAYPYYGQVVTALYEFWEHGGGRTLWEVVADLGMEIGLF
jgi:hypothetical protein